MNRIKNHLIVMKNLIRTVHINILLCARKPMRTNYPSLQKHLKPDLLSGKERRQSLVKKDKLTRYIATPIRKQTRGFIPSKFKLGPIISDVNRKPSSYKYSNRENTMNEEALSIVKFSKKVSEVNFSDMKLNPEIILALNDHLKTAKQPIKPTEIQALAIPEILKETKKHYLCAAETGCGKTLAYLIPILQLIKDSESHEQVQAEQSDLIKTNRKLNRPIAIILAPSCALVQQVNQVSKSLSHTIKFRSLCLTRDTSRKDLSRRLSLPIDVIISTPASLKRYVGDGTISLSDARYLVVDEADTLFDEGFGPDVEELIKEIELITTNRKMEHKIVIVSATLPKKIMTKLDSYFPELVKITTPSLHKALPRCVQHFIDLKSYKGNRYLAFLDIIKQYESRKSAPMSVRENDRIMVFCNTVQALFLLKKFLNTKNIPALCLFGRYALDKEVIPATKEQLELFMNPKNMNTHLNDDQELQHSVSPKMVICTDIASRGIDSKFVNHVVLFDFPSSIIDYLHRIGRTARFNSNGVVTALVGKRDRNLAERIRRSIRSKTVLS